MSIKTILLILAGGFIVSFLAVPTCRMISGTPEDVPVPVAAPSKPAPESKAPAAEENQGPAPEISTID